MDFITFAYGQLATELDYIMRRMANVFKTHPDFNTNNVKCWKRDSSESGPSMGNLASFPLPDKMKEARTSTPPTDDKAGVIFKSSDFFAAGAPGFDSADSSGRPLCVRAIEMLV